MSICASGFSQAKAGVDTSIYVDAAYIKSILPAGLAWAYDYLPYMGGLAIGDVGAFCAIDPPTWTIPTGPQIVEFLTGGLREDYRVVNQFLQDVTRAYLWHELCECSSGPTPAPPSAPAAPVGAPVVNPPDIVSPPGEQPSLAPCVSSALALFSSVYTTDYGTNVLGTTAATGWDMHWGPYPGNTAFQTYAVNTIRTKTRRNSVGAGPHQNVTWGIRWQTPSALLFVTTFVDAPDGIDHIRDWVVPPGATNLLLQYGVAAVSADTVQAHTEGYCNVPPGTTNYAQNCCPPDPALLALMHRLDSMVTLIQRQSVPFAYVYGTNHSGLTNDGEIAVADLIGVSVELTVIPSSYGRHNGTPETFHDLGFVSLGTPDGWITSRRIDHDGSLIIPSSAGLFTRIGYSLSPGVEASIRELVREP